ncbi:MAG: HIT domain-containing protein [Nitrospina sp.]|jgi:ATP adenylyltransferase|nr:HIT domain-containing protein [Nitrospina sp.]
MKQLWAPWRMEYIKSDKSDACIFCTLPRENEDEKNYILYRGKAAFIIMNIFPYNSAHLMVSPFRHIGCLTEQNSDETSELNRLTNTCIEILRKVINPEGFNVGYNIGKAAGAGYDEHIHCHIVPRWIGDTNFMPVLGETKVHPEHLKSTYSKLLPHFKDL